jgi:hypothetical protein
MKRIIAAYSVLSIVLLLSPAAWLLCHAQPPKLAVKMAPLPPRSNAEIIAAIKFKMHAIELWASQSVVGLSEAAAKNETVYGSVGFSKARDYLMARDHTYQLLDKLLLYAENKTNELDYSW